jgi:flavin-dependent dehydrogenase
MTSSTSAARSIACDVLVIGGGPAGTAAAIGLLRRGYRVVILEGSGQASRNTQIQSLPLAALPIIESLLGRETAGGFECHEASLDVRWGTRAQRHPGGPHAGAPFDKGTTLLVGRSSLDVALRSATRAAGGVLLEGMLVALSEQGDGKVRSVSDPFPPVGWNASIRLAGQAAEVHARFVVIATGRRGGFGGKRQRRGAATLAIARLWQNTRGPAWSICEAGNEAWCWAGAFPDGRTCVMAVVDPGGDAPDRHASLGAAYHSIVEQSRLIHGRLDGEPAGPLYAMDASRGLTLPVASRSFLRVGEAAVTLDPLSSQGLMVALISGLQGAVAAQPREYRHSRCLLLATPARSRRAR